ncbi:MAG TPA: PTS system mannose/fructose/sorbose family transporter subunit IID [Gemmatimonadales bacterium]|nr:PTS system mannose/fructose/sorbose family transporter subunit IID [Gemmatimonadales bacterium]
MRIGRLRALIRLLSLQASYTYERLQGVGIAVAQEPLLEPLGKDSERARAARARSAQYFNAHPFLAGIAVGALSRAELDGEEGNRILRLRAALSGPLGALGDQLFWAGIVPALMGLALVAAAHGRGLEAVLGVVIGYNVCRILVTGWGLRLGLTHGLGVAHEIAQSRLREITTGAGALAAFVIGGAIPWIALWLLQGAGQSRLFMVGLVAGSVGLGVLTRRRPLSAPALTLGAAAVTLVWRWGSP